MVKEELHTKMRLRRRHIRKYAQRLASVLAEKGRDELVRLVEQYDSSHRTLLGHEVFVKLNQLGDDFEVSVTSGVSGSIFPVGELFQPRAAI